VTARDRILAEARSHFERGGRPSIEELTAAAGVSRATFYRHFRSRAELLRKIAVEPGPGSRERVLEAAAELLATTGLAGLATDRLAERAKVSRATLYRLFPGRPALVSALMRAYSPIDPVVDLIERKGDRPPEEVMPEVAVLIFRVFERNRGFLRALALEVTSLEPDTRQAVQDNIGRLLAALGGYILAQMAAGRLRRLHPVVAIQAFGGPLIFHVLLNPVLQDVFGVTLDSEAAARQFGQIWVAGMAPEAGQQGL